MLKIIVISSNKKGRCGIKEYTERVFNKEYYYNNFVKILPISFINLIKAPFLKADIIHLQHEFFLFDSLIGFSGLLFIIYFKLISLVTRQKLVTTIHSVHNPYNLEQALPHFAKYKILFPLLSFYLKTYYFFIILASQKTIVLSQSSANILQEVSKGVPNKIQVLPHGVFPRLLNDTNTNILQEKYNIAKNAKIWTLFGFAFENKGYHLAIQALAKILEEDKESKIQLIIVSGEGQTISAKGKPNETYLSYLKRITNEYKLQDKVTFTGFLGYDEPAEKDLLAEIFTKTYAFLFPYYNRSNASGAMASILSYEKPVLVSDVQYFQEFSFLPNFKEGDVNDLVNKIVNFDEEYQANKTKIKQYVDSNSLKPIFELHLKEYANIKNS